MDAREPTDRDIVRRMEELSRENARLLDELEQVYLQMESYISSSTYETDIAYGELERKNRELEERLRDLEQTHQRLKETQNQLVHAERLSAMGQLAATLVHEIKNPLAIIFGRIELMLMSKRYDERDLRTMQRECMRLSELSDNILYFCRRQAAEYRLISVNGVLEDLIRFLEVVKKNEVTIETAFDRRIALVYADSGQLEQIFLNLIVNAFDAMDGSGRLNIITRMADFSSIIEAEQAARRPYVLSLEVDQRAEQETGQVCVEISDEGTGIPEKQLKDIFEAFFSTKAEGKGTGLGLSISRTIVEHHKGNLMVASEYGKGATFRVFLPPSKEMSAELGEGVSVG